MFRSPDQLPPSLPLSSLDEIPWSDLTHAYGVAEDVPATLKAFASGGEEAEQASDELYGTIFHQGTRYTASPFAVPFFVGLLERRDLLPDLLERLLVMAIGYEEEWFPRGFHLEFARAQQRQLDAEPENKFGIDAVRTHEAVSRAAGLVRDMLDDQDPVVRSEAAHLLAYLPEQGESSLEAMLERLDTSADARPSFLLSIGILGRQLAIPADIGPKPSSADSLEVQVGWRCAASLLGHEEIVDELVDLMSQDLPPIATWLEGSTSNLVLSSVAVHKGWLTEGRIRSIAKQLDVDGPFKAAWLADTLLQNVFSKDLPPERSSDLSPNARLVLEALHDSESWGTGAVKNANWSMTMGGYHVPADRESLGRYLQGADLNDCLTERSREGLQRARDRRLNQR